ncbi:MAG: hypothetical protein Q4G59_04190 [Planctomycetia bacterium]|nr:hypothetical protein [Planctomycetia bacterium]
MKNKLRLSGRACVSIVLFSIMQLSAFFIALELNTQRKYDFTSWMVPVFLWVVPVLVIGVIGVMKKTRKGE